MRTIKRHWPKSAPRGDYTSMCDLCGFAYRRSQLAEVPGGHLRCSGSGTIDCAIERTAEELDIGNAQGNVMRKVLPIGGNGLHGSFDDDDGT